MERHRLRSFEIPFIRSNEEYCERNMIISINEANIGAHGIQLDGLLDIQDIKLTGVKLLVECGSNVGFRVTDASISMAITEVEINRYLSTRSFQHLRNLETAILSGQVRLKGRYNPIGAITTKFQATAVPQIESGCRIRFDFRQINIVGAIPLPGFTVSMIGERINAEIAEAMDTSKLPIPLQLVSIALEPGRIQVVATATISLQSVSSDASLRLLHESE